MTAIARENLRIANVRDEPVELVLRRRLRLTIVESEKRRFRVAHHRSLLRRLLVLIHFHLLITFSLASHLQCIEYILILVSGGQCGGLFIVAVAVIVVVALHSTRMR